VEPEPAKFRSKGTGVGAIKGKWPAPETDLRSFQTLAQEQEPEPLKFSRLHQLWPSGRFTWLLLNKIGILFNSEASTLFHKQCRWSWGCNRTP